MLNHNHCAEGVCFVVTICIPMLFLQIVAWKKVVSEGMALTQVQIALFRHCRLTSGQALMAQLLYICVGGVSRVGL